MCPREPHLVMGSAGSEPRMRGHQGVMDVVEVCATSDLRTDPCQGPLGNEAVEIRRDKVGGGGEQTGKTFRTTVTEKLLPVQADLEHAVDFRCHSFRDFAPKVRARLLRESHQRPKRIRVLAMDKKEVVRRLSERPIRKLGELFLEFPPNAISVGQSEYGRGIGSRLAGPSERLGRSQEDRSPALLAALLARERIDQGERVTWARDHDCKEATASFVVGQRQLEFCRPNPLGQLESLFPNPPGHVGVSKIDVCAQVSRLEGRR